MPQVSVLGPILYCIYTGLIGDIVARHGLQFLCYADDIQTYMTMRLNQQVTEVIIKIDQWLAEMTDWYETKLKLNTEKSEEVIFLTSRQQNHVPYDISLTIGGH